VWLREDDTHADWDVKPYAIARSTTLHLFTEGLHHDLTTNLTHLTPEAMGKRLSIKPDDPGMRRGSPRDRFVSPPQLVFWPITPTLA
jgi:hypothetical protein